MSRRPRAQRQHPSSGNRTNNLRLTGPAPLTTVIPHRREPTAPFPPAGESIPPSAGLGALQTRRGETSFAYRTGPWEIARKSRRAKDAPAIQPGAGKTKRTDVCLFCPAVGNVILVRVGGCRQNEEAFGGEEGKVGREGGGSGSRGVCLRGWASAECHISTDESHVHVFPSTCLGRACSHSLLQSRAAL